MAKPSLTLAELYGVYETLCNAGCEQMSIPAFLRAVEAHLEDGDVKGAVYSQPVERWPTGYRPALDVSPHGPDCLLCNGTGWKGKSGV